MLLRSKFCFFGPFMSKCNDRSDDAWFFSLGVKYRPRVTITVPTHIDYWFLMVNYYIFFLNTICTNIFILMLTKDIPCNKIIFLLQIKKKKTYYKRTLSQQGLSLLIGSSCTNDETVTWKLFNIILYGFTSEQYTICIGQVVDFELGLQLRCRLWRRRALGLCKIHFHIGLRPTSGCCSVYKMKCTDDQWTNLRLIADPFGQGRFYAGRHFHR